MRDVSITTYDNPYDPFTNFLSWFAFDSEKGYNSLSLLARASKTSIELPDHENEETIEQAIDEICRLHNYSIFKKVVRNT